MGESATRYSGVKWTVQLPQELAGKAELARRLSGLNRQELLEAYLTAFINANMDHWTQSVQSLVGSTTPSAKTKN